MPRVKVSGLRSVKKNIANLQDRLLSNMDSHTQLFAAQLENYAKANASWTDRTGNARASITGSQDADRDGIVITLSIGVDYGKYLEVSNAGRYAIVWPTINAHRQDFLSVLQKGFK